MGDNETVTTAELLDLIQRDVASSSSAPDGPRRTPQHGGPSSSGLRGRRNTTRSSSHPAGAGHAPTSSPSADPFTVRLSSGNRRPGGALSGALSSDEESSGDDEADDSVGDMRSGRYAPRFPGGGNPSGADNHSSATMRNKRQRMPVGGGYGGMFAPDTGLANAAAASSDRSQSSGRTGGTGNRSASSSTADNSSLSGSIFSFASNIFLRNQPGGGGGSRGGGSRRHWRGSGASHGSRGSASRFSASRFNGDENTVTNRLSAAYLALPYRTRHALRLFSAVGALLLASLNYFIGMERGGAVLGPSRGGGLDYPLVEGGGLDGSVPHLRVHDPLKFLHTSRERSGGLLRAARKKMSLSRRFGSAAGGGGPAEDDAAIMGDPPFQYGWRSMPRQVLNDFSSGLSDDAGTTIPHAAAAAAGSTGADAATARAPPRGRVGYVLPVTSCYPGKDGSGSPTGHPNQPRDEASFRDFAIMLRAMVHASSYRNPASGSEYDYRAVAIVHPRAKKCRAGGGDEVVDRALLLQNLGYEVLVAEAPEFEPRGPGADVLKAKLDGDRRASAGLAALHAYRLTKFDAVALVDYGTLVLGPVDGAVDLIAGGGDAAERRRRRRLTHDDGEGASTNTGAGRRRLASMEDALVGLRPEEDGSSPPHEEQTADEADEDGLINAVFSWERLPSKSDPTALVSVVNTSFLLLRPSLYTFAKVVGSLGTAPFAEGKGWGATGRGVYDGWTSARGFLTYYYDEVENVNKVELGRCSYGSAGAPYSGADGAGARSALVTSGGRVDCAAASSPGGATDTAGPCDGGACGPSPDVRVADLGPCRAPWECSGDGRAEEGGACAGFRRGWFAGRLQMEDVHPQLERGEGKLCVDGRYLPMALVADPGDGDRPQFVGREVESAIEGA